MPTVKVKIDQETLTTYELAVVESIIKEKKVVYIALQGREQSYSDFENGLNRICKALKNPLEKSNKKELKDLKKWTGNSSIKEILCFPASAANGRLTITINIRW